MARFPLVANVDPLVISTASPQSVGAAYNAGGYGSASSTWPSANRAYYIPFSVYSTFVVAKMFMLNGATISGNLDVGIYDRSGKRLVSSGSVAHVNANSPQEFTISITLNPGLYFMAAAMDNTSGNIVVWTPTGTFARAIGIQEQSSAFVLPSTATFAAISGTVRPPFIALTSRSVV